MITENCSTAVKSNTVLVPQVYQHEETSNERAFLTASENRTSKGGLSSDEEEDSPTRPGNNRKTLSQEILEEIFDNRQITYGKTQFGSAQDAVNVMDKRTQHDHAATSDQLVGRGYHPQATSSSQLDKKPDVVSPSTGTGLALY